MNDQKPNTQAQREVDEILRQDASNKAQKEIDAAVSEMDKGQQDASPKSAPAPESKTQGEDNDYYNGMSQ